MYITKRSIVIDRELKNVYEVAETYPTFVGFFLEGTRILDKSDDHLKVEVHNRLFGFRTHWQGEGVKRQYRNIRFRQTQGLLTNLLARWSFLPVGKKTKVTIMTRFSKWWLTPLGEQYFGKFIVEKVTQGILEELKLKSEIFNGVQ